MIALAESETTHEHKLAHTATAENAAKPLVLIIEHHEDTRQMLELFVASLDYRAACAPDGAQGLTLACAMQPALVLTDAMLPVLDGLTLAREIRRSPSVGDVPIVFFSGRAESWFRASALAAGADEYLVKPLGLNRLETVLAALIKQKPQNRRAFAKEFTV